MWEVKRLFSKRKKEYSRDKIQKNKDTESCIIGAGRVETAPGYEVSEHLKNQKERDISQHGSKILAAENGGDNHRKC